MPSSNYDKTPTVSAIAGSRAVKGWAAIGKALRSHLGKKSPRCAIALECYPGVFLEELRKNLREKLGESLWLETESAFLDRKSLDHVLKPYLGADDPVFGVLCPLPLEALFDADKLLELRNLVAGAPGIVIVAGPGALVVRPEADVIVYADLARWEIQQRQRKSLIGNLGIANESERPGSKYKRAFFIDWRVCDRLKRDTLPRWDFLLDTNIPGKPKLITGEDLRKTLAGTAARPFRVVPFFDPGPWGGQWMKKVCDLDRSQPNFAWCFDCVPEENSLLLDFDGTRVEIPALDLVLAEPAALLGRNIFKRFGAEFPIRFDFLDTMGGGNLSLQVHPPAKYARRHFGLRYAQDESYYLLDAEPDAKVYLGRRKGANLKKMFAALAQSQKTGLSFPAEKFAASWPAKKHDHFLIPAGTLHCSGAGSMVLEISATPYIFTFKLWDWNRPGLDGRPRPIHLEYGRAALDWKHDETYARKELINRVKLIAKGRGWREERTGLHPLEFIETRRHWFTRSVSHHTKGNLNVLNLIEGAEAIIESPDKAFDPFIVHYAETFIVPAAVGPYTIRPHGKSTKKQCATIKAFVRPQS